MAAGVAGGADGLGEYQGVSDQGGNDDFLFERGVVGVDVLPTNTTEPHWADS